MNLRRLYTLLVLWCVFLLGPAVLLALGMFGRLDMHTNIPGGVALFWILGYLAQFGVFMWIAKIVDEQNVLLNVLSWFVASLLPWAVDWTLPVSPWFILLWLPVTTAQAIWIAVRAGQKESLEEHGVRATGVVLEVLKPMMNVVINNVYIKRKVRLRVERKDGVPAYEGVLDGLFMMGEIPSPGDRIPLLVDPARPQRFEYDKGAGSETTAPRRAAAQAATGGEYLAHDLERLAQLHDRGVLSDAEFAAAKKKLLRE